MKTKHQAVALFGSASALAKALGVTPQRIYQWPEELSLDQSDRVRGAALRLGLLTSKKRGKAQDEAA